MDWIVRSSSRISKGVFIIALGIAGADSTRAAAPTPARTTDQVLNQRAQAETRGRAYAVGDRLKIMFFEQLSANSRAVLSQLIERSEMTGEYQIQEDGYVFLPLLGPVSAANKSYDQLQGDLERAFTTQMEGHIKVSIQLIDREPIYVIGPVTRPGTFKYVPGMTVGHVLALAGGLEGTNADLWRVLDLGREQERINKASERLMRLLAISEVLTAEAARRKPVPSQQLLDLAGRARGQQLVDGEERFRALKRQKLDEQESAIAALIAANENELRILREKLTQVEVRIKEKAERAKAMAVLRTKGTTTDTSFYFAQSEAGDALERWHEVRTAIAQAERKTVELQQERQKLAIDAAVSREEELKQASIASAEEAVTIKVLGNLLATMPIAKTYAGDRRLNFKIIRRTPTGVQELSAKGVQSLEPGDLLQVTPIEVEATASRAGI